MLPRNESNDLTVHRQCRLTDIILVFPRDANSGNQIYSDPHKATLLQQGAGENTAIKCGTSS